MRLRITRNVVLAVGLVFSLIGMVLTILVLEGVGSYLGDRWPFSYIIPQSMSFYYFWQLISLPTGLFVVIGFLILAFAILIPKPSPEPLPENENENENTPHETEDDADELQTDKQ